MTRTLASRMTNDTTTLHGWGPINWQAKFLAAATKSQKISMPVLLDLCDAVNGAKPILSLPRWRENKRDLHLEIECGNDWTRHNMACLGMGLLWQVHRVSIDGKPVDVCDVTKFDAHWHARYPDTLKAGDHQIVADVECAYIDSAKLLGVDGNKLPSAFWPEARRRWKTAVSSVLKIHKDHDQTVAMVTDEQRSPGPNGGILIERAVVQADQKGKKMVVRIKLPKKLLIAASYDATAVVEGQSVPIELGPVWAYSVKNTWASNGNTIEKSIDNLPRSADHIAIRLTPNPRHVDGFPAVSEIWGKPATLENVPLERLDLSVDRP